MPPLVLFWQQRAQADLAARLMYADPESIAGDKELAGFALALARPAYERHCAACHGADLAGDPRRGVPALTRTQRLYGEGRVAELERTILYGIRSGTPKAWNLADMPAFAEPVPYRRYAIDPLEPRDIADTVEFILVSGQRSGDTQAASRGAEIFQGRGQCFDCHGRDLRGDSAIGAPSLVGGSFLYGDGTRAALARTISHGAAGYCPAWYGRLDAGTIRALAFFIARAPAKEGAG